MPAAKPISHAEMIAFVADGVAMMSDAVGAKASRDLEILQAILAHLERTQWRPIEEAPKDRDWLLVGWESYDKGVAGCSDAAFWHDGSDNYWKHAGWYALEDRGNVLTAKPLTGMTHYMLPPSPETP